MAAEFTQEPAKEPVVLNEDLPPEPEALEGRGIEVEGAPEPEPEPEPRAESERQREMRMVPLPALHEERARRRQLEAEFMQYRQAEAERWGRAQGRMDELARRLETAAPPRAEPDEPEPDPEKDPRGWVNWQFRQRDKRYEAIERQLAERDRYLQQREQEFQNEILNTRQSVAQHQQQRQLEAVVDSSEEQIRAAVPYYDDAIDYIAQRRDRELEALGVDDPRQRQVMLAREVQGTIQAILASGRDPASTFLEYAQAGGFRPGGAASPLDRIRKGQAVSRSLARGGGQAPRHRITPQMLADMSEDEYSRLVPDRDTFRRMQET